MVGSTTPYLLRTISLSLSLFFNDTATTEIYTLSLHDALPICLLGRRVGHGLRIALAHRTIVFFGRQRHVHPVVELAEDHFPRGGLQHAGHRNIDGLGNHLLGVIHHHHGAVIQVSHALVVLLAFFEDEDPHGLAG